LHVWSIDPEAHQGMVCGRTFDPARCSEIPFHFPSSLSMRRNHVSWRRIVVRRLNSGMDMPHLRLARFTLWIMAVLVAAVMAFGPTAAAAHPGHEHHRHVMSSASPVSPSSEATANSRLTVSATFASPAEQQQDEHSGCGGVCCSGSSCCAPACLTPPVRMILIPVGLAVRQPMLEARAPDGVDPVSLLRPPRLFA